MIEIDHPVLGPYKTFGPPIRMDATPTRVQSPSPLFDQHTDEVLGQLGFDVGQVAQLRAEGVAGAAGAA